MMPVNLHAVQSVENANDQLQTGEINAITRLNIQRLNRSALYSGVGSYSTAFNNNCTTTNTSEVRRFENASFVNETVDSEIVVVSNGNLSMNHGKSRLVVQQDLSHFHSFRQGSTSEITNPRRQRTRGRPRLGTNRMTIDGEVAPYSISAVTHRNLRRRERRLLQRGIHVDNCKYSSTADLLALDR